jgi:hypothetical protein
MNIIKNRWPLGEAVIRLDSHISKWYDNFIETCHKN